jgi:hypothetical protein
MGPRNHRKLCQAAIVAAMLMLTLCAVVVPGSGCEARPQAIASSQDHPAQLTTQQPDSSDGSGNDRAPVEQHPVAPVPLLPPAPAAVADRNPVPRLENNAAKLRPAETDPGSSVALPPAATMRAQPCGQQAAPAQKAKAPSPQPDTMVQANPPAHHEAAQSPTPHIEPHFANPDELVSVNFDNVDIRTVLKTIGDETGINFIPHQSVTGTVTVMSPTRIRLGDLYPFLQSILDVAGYATIEMDNVVKVVPKAEAVKSHTQVRFGADPARIPNTDMIARQIIPLKYADASEISEIVTPILSPGRRCFCFRWPMPPPRR